MRNLFRFVGLRHLQSKPSRTILTTLGVACGVSLFIAIQIINRSTLHSFKESIDAVAGKATLVVSAGSIGFSEDKLEVIEKFPGVSSAVPMIETRAYLAGTGTKAESLVILGIDLLKEQSVRTYKKTDEEVIDDPLIFLNQPDSVIVSKIFAKQLNLDIDSKLEIATARGKRTLVVRGMLTPEGPAKAYGGSLAIMDIDGARQTFGKVGKLDRVDIVTKNNVDVDNTAAQLQALLGPGFKVEKPEGQSESMNRLVKSYQVMLTFFSTLALIVGIFLVTNSVSISVAERKKEIGILRALGTIRVSILSLFLLEGLFMGVFGSFVGVWMGRGLSYLMVDLVTKSVSMQYLTPIKASKLVFDNWDFVQGLTIGAVTAVIASLYPSYKATTVQPLEAMKRQEEEITGKKSLFSASTVLGLLLAEFALLSAKYQWGAKSKVLELANQTSGMMAAALLGPIFVGLLIWISRNLVVGKLGAVPRLAQDNLIRNPRRTGSNVTSLMVGLILVIMIASLNFSFKSHIGGWFERILYSDIIISSSGRLISYQVQPLSEDLGKIIEKIPGVKMGPERGAYSIRFIHFNYLGKQLGLKAFDRPDPNSNYSVFDLKDRDKSQAGPEFFDAKENVCFVSENFVLHFGKKTGDRITIETPTGAHEIRIIGMITDFASNEGILYLPRPQYKKMFNDNLVDGFGVKVAQGYDVADVRRRIDQEIGQKMNLITMSNTEMKNEILKSVDDGFAYSRAIELAALLVGLLGLLNTFLVSVMERTRELGMLRAVGMTRSQVLRLILIEALIQGGFGAIVAACMGGLLAWLWITHSLSLVLGWVIHFYFPWYAIVTTILTGIIVTFISGIYPAWKASRIQIREALEYE